MNKKCAKCELKYTTACPEMIGRICFYTLNDEATENEAEANGDYDEKSKKIIKHYGICPQAKYMMSEIYELIEAIQIAEQFRSYDNTDNARIEHVAEEIADVFVFLKQFCAYYGISWGKVEEIAHYKIDRQLQRIEQENWQ